MDRVTPPPFRKSLEFNLPKSEKVFSVGDNEIWHIPSTVGETVKVEVIFKAGKYFEKSPGEAQLTLHLLDKGINGKTSNEIANELDYYGAHLDLKIGYDFSSVALFALRKNLTPLLSLLTRIIQEPIFLENELRLLQKIFIENLRVNLEKNEFIASNLIRERLFGTHPYGRNLQISDIQNIDLEKVSNFHKRRLKPFKIFIVGNVDQKEIQTIQQNFNLSESPDADIITINELEPSHYQVDGPSKKQASIRLAKKTIAKTHPQWPSLQLLNHILGGFFGSRLMKNIREEKGLTYGIHSSIMSMLHSSAISISAEVNSQSLELALIEIRNELKSLDNIQHEELEMAKNHIIGTLQNDITTIYAAAERIKNLILNNLPFNYYQNLIKTISSTDHHEILKIWIDQFNVDDFSSIVVK